MEQVNQQISSAHNWLARIAFIFFAVMLIAFLGIVYVSNKNYETPTSLNPTPIVYTAPSPTPDPTINWSLFSGTNLNIQFKYPPTYSEPKESRNYISFMSPLNSNTVKGSGLQNGELKMEIYFENAKSNLTLEAYVKEKTDTGTQIIEQSEKTLGGVKAIHQKWKGYGTGETYYVVYGGKKIMIVKYPLETTRQSEFEQILSTVKFMDSQIMSNQISPQEKQQIDAWITKNNLNEYGDRKDTVYTGGTPLFDEMTEKSIDKYEYILKQHPDRPWVR